MSRITSPRSGTILVSFDREKPLAFVWLVECKTCLLRFAVKARELVPGKSTTSIPPATDAGSFECPHCHEVHDYSTDDFIPGEGRLFSL